MILKRYLNKNSSVRHFISNLLNARNGVSLCNISPYLFADLDDWLGTGSQIEYEKLEQLPDCKNCVKIIGRKL